MARNGSGTYNLPAGNPVTTGATISSTWANSTLSDMASALTGSVASDGQTTPTANLPMGTFSHTNVGNATVRNMYTSAGQIQDGVVTYLTSVAGTNVITAVGAVGMTAYATGQTLYFIAAGANTGAVTININSIGAKSLVRPNGSALVSGDIVSGAVIQITYDGTNFQLISVAAGAFTNLNLSGNLNFTTTGNRITGDLSNATESNRVLFQTSTTNGNSTIGVIPNGTATSAAVSLYGSATTANSTYGLLQQSGTSTRLIASKDGTGSYGDLEFWTNGSKQGYFKSTGNLYTTGSIQLAEGTGSADTAVELAANRTADGNSYIDFHSALISAGGTGDYDLRIIRNTGTNGSTQIINLGTGGIYLSNNNITSLFIDPSHNSQFPVGAVMPYAPTPTSISAATTLTNANIQAQIINTTGTSYTVTLPTGSTLETIANWVAFNIGYDFYVINTASGTITIGANGNSTLGSLTVASNTSAQFRLRRTASNTFTVYRLA